MFPQKRMTEKGQLFIYESSNPNEKHTNARRASRIKKLFKRHETLTILQVVSGLQAIRFST